MTAWLHVDMVSKPHIQVSQLALAKESSACCLQNRSCAVMASWLQPQQLPPQHRLLLQPPSDPVPAEMVSLESALHKALRSCSTATSCRKH